jgi:hypothetical protein
VSAAEFKATCASSPGDFIEVDTSSYTDDAGLWFDVTEAGTTSSVRLTDDDARRLARFIDDAVGDGKDVEPVVPLAAWERALLAPTPAHDFKVGDKVVATGTSEFGYSFGGRVAVYRGDYTRQSTGELFLILSEVGGSRQVMFLPGRVRPATAADLYEVGDVVKVLNDGRSSGLRHFLAVGSLASVTASASDTGSLEVHGVGAAGSTAPGRTITQYVKASAIEPYTAAPAADTEEDPF